MAWTNEMVAELKRLWAEGVTTGEIGRRLNISKNSIVGKVHRLGLSGRPSPIKKKTDQDTSKKDVSKQKPQPKKKEVTPVKKEQKVEQPKQKMPVKPKPEQQKPAKKVETKQASKTVTPAADEEADIKLAQSLNMTESKNKNTGALHLTDLDNHTCRWPLGDPKDENFHFCGKKVKMGQTYCEEHSAVAYVKPNKK